MPPDPPKHLPTGPPAEPMDCPPELLDVTLDQLRTLLAVRLHGSALRAARALGREQSSVQKQLDTLNRGFQALCGETLVIKQGRGRDFRFTVTGEAIVERARQTLGDWLTDIHASRRRLGGSLTVGTTEFALRILSRAWESLAEEFDRRGVDFRIVHVRTKDIWARLEAGDVDLLCGSVVMAAGDAPGEGAHGSYDVLEWRRGSPVVLTNLPEGEGPGPVVAASELGGLPLIVPSAGLVADFLTRWYGTGFRHRMNVVADIEDLHYGLALMRYGMISGCMIVTGTIATRALQGDLPGGGGLRAAEIVPDLEPKLEMVAGVFARAGERARYAPDHPLNLLWEALADQVTADTTD